MQNLIRHLLFTSLLFSIEIVSGQDLELQWVKGITGTDAISKVEILVDNQKNSYIIGSFAGTADFDPGSGTVNLSSSNGAAYFAKYDAMGNYIFAFQTNINIRAMVFDNSENICITGSYDSTGDFDFGAGVKNLPLDSGAYNYYISKYDKDGKHILAFPIVSGSKVVEINALGVDANNNFFITGGFLGTADFNPGNGLFNLVSNAISINQDIFLAKYNVSGVLTFAFKLGGSKQDDARDLAIDKDGNTYIAGFFYGAIDLDPGSGISSFSFLGLNGFLGKYDPSGNYLAGYGLDAVLFKIALDKAGNIYYTGHVQDSMDVDPGPGKLKLYSKYINTFIGKLDPAGKFQYARLFNSNGYCLEYEMTIDGQDNMYLCGSMDDTTYFNQQANTGILTTHGGNDGYLTKFDASGKFITGFSLGGTSTDIIHDMALDNNGGVWMAGTFNGTVDFDPGPATVSLTTSPKTGVFFGRYKDPLYTGSIASPNGQEAINIFGTDDKVFVDFTHLTEVNAHVKVVNILGQTIAETNHASNDMLKIELPETSGQICVVIVSNNGFTKATKIWVR